MNLRQIVLRFFFVLISQVVLIQKKFKMLLLTFLGDIFEFLINGFCFGNLLPL